MDNRAENNEEIMNRLLNQLFNSLNDCITTFQTLQTGHYVYRFQVLH